ncbi:hypothetical protein PpBr36_01432 [Pyricularia pennisetigena]|uniref:hypothetical protein n=1 Tax=Pyricularia pennisetigena TaxID=1578925 RepID=UPI001153ADCF|nr:hypothetical protein PpBr36_01432 [Pyricularia pennisetigena]TLS28372.1 hypothetical protein PpBr36_01432 [Pyricularia pennisetigena]
MLSFFKLSVALLAATQLAAAQTPVAKIPIELERRDNGCAVSGLINGQCARFFLGTGCKDMVTQIKPDCQGKCHSFPNGIRSVEAAGDGTRGTDCELYSDDNCQTSMAMGRTGNTIFKRKCHTASKERLAKSVKCWFACK